MGRIASFKQKEVVNINDGKRLGFVSDVDVNFEDGKLEAIIVAGAGKVLGVMGKDSELVIPYEKIDRIGEDIIIVNIEERYLR
ncbi:MAG: YlmC/YmxH family sporulation protein [Clostridiales bacterium]|nr:YlmC/YmxH family sporulation protein [Clostridiales bacterium]